MVRRKAQDPYELAIAALARAAPDTFVVFVGPACRTWYADIDRLRAVMSDLFEVREYTVIHGGKFPFDMYVEEHANGLGIPNIMVGPAPRETRLSVRYERDADLAMCACLVVAFPAEEAPPEDGLSSKVYPPESADLDVIRNAQQHGVPVLAIYRNGNAVWEET